MAATAFELHRASGSFEAGLHVDGVAELDCAWIGRMSCADGSKLGVAIGETVDAGIDLHFAIGGAQLGVALGATHVGCGCQME